MAELEKVIKGLEFTKAMITFNPSTGEDIEPENLNEENKTTYDACVGAIALLKEQEKKQITLHKKHVVTWNRNDTFSMRNLYEAICEELLDEGELFIARTDDHEKVDFVFYVTEGR